MKACCRNCVSWKGDPCKAIALCQVLKVPTKPTYKCKHYVGFGHAG